MNCKQLCQDPSVSFFWKGKYGIIKNGKCQLLKIARSRPIVILVKSWKSLELALNQHMLAIFVRQHNSIWPSFILIGVRIKRNKHKCNFHYAAMLMMTSQILKSLDFTKTQKSRYLENETLFLQIKKIINCTLRVTLLQKIVL